MSAIPEPRKSVRRSSSRPPRRPIEPAKPGRSGGRAGRRGGRDDVRRRRGPGGRGARAAGRARSRAASAAPQGPADRRDALVPRRRAPARPALSVCSVSRPSAPRADPRGVPPCCHPASQSSARPRRRRHGRLRLARRPARSATRPTTSFRQTEAAQAMLRRVLDQETGLRGYLLNGAGASSSSPTSRPARVRAPRWRARRDAGGDDARRQRAARRAPRTLTNRWRDAGRGGDHRARRGRRSSAALRRKALMDEFRETNAELRLRLAERARRRRCRGDHALGR